MIVTLSIIALVGIVLGVVLFVVRDGVRER